MKKALCVFVSLVLLLGCAGLPAFAEGYASAAEANAALAQYYEKFRRGFAEDVDGDDIFSARDARTILLYSAELYDRLDTAKVRVERMDLDHDGIVTAVDARMALRFSAHLIEDDKFTTEQKLEMFNIIINNLKGSVDSANRSDVGFYYATRSDSQINWDNNDAVNSFDSQMAALSTLNGDTPEKFSDILRTAEGTEYWAPRTTKNRYLSTAAHPLQDAKVSSRLTLDDIQSIEYKRNQSVTLTFTYKIVNNVPIAYIDPVELTGLDAISVTVRGDSVNNVSSEIANFHSAKVFDIPSTEELNSELAEAQNTLQEVEKEFNSIKDEESIRFLFFEFKPTDLFKSFKFSGQTGFDKYTVKPSTVTIYFNPSTGKPIASTYSLNYDVITRMTIDTDITLKTAARLFMNLSLDRDKRIKKDALLVINNQTIRITTSTTDFANYYYATNDPNNSLYNLG